MSRYTGIAMVYLVEGDLEYYTSTPYYEFYILQCTYRKGRWYWKKSDQSVIVLN